VIELRDTTVAFGPQVVLRELSLEIAAGATTVLLGRSGCGKTSLLRLVNGMLSPTSGQVLVEGEATESWDLIRLRRRCGYVIQDAGLLPHYTVGRNVGLVPELEGWVPDRIRDRVAEMLELVGLEPGDYRERFPHELSGGQRQRVGVARALAADPPLLLCDEPFGALDPITRTELQDEFRKMSAQLSKTIVFVTHDVREALKLADRILLLADGGVAVDATADEFREADHAEARAFLASIAVEVRS
jgi:osmoprotectant transport system ATP-binding protein